MSNNITWRILVVDDDPDLCRQIKEYLEDETTSQGDNLQIETTTDFAAALDRLESRRFDIVILDLRLGEYAVNPAEEAGAKTLKDIQASCFVPVIFHSGVAHLIGIENPAIRVLTKEPGFPLLLQTISEVIDTKLPAINRALIRHVEEVQRGYMWEFVVGHWDQFRDTSDQTSLAYLLARRLAVSLSGTGMDKLVKEFGVSASTSTADDTIHPMQYYVMPPIQQKPLAGDLYKETVADKDVYRILLTPSCDIYQGKADMALLARCALLTEQPEYKASHDARQANSKLKQLLKNNRDKQPDRFHFLPGVFTLPDLIVDFQQLETIPYNQLQDITRVTSLDSPFAEALMARFARYFSRLGTPDLNMESVLSRIGLGSSSAAQP